MVQSLQKAVPELDQLYANPAATLAQTEIRIASQKIYGVIIGVWVLALFTPAFLKWKFRLDLSGQTQLLIMGGIALASLILLFVPFGLEIILRAEGVTLRRRGAEVFCPWALFNAPGNVFISHGTLTLPIAPEAIPFVTQRQDDHLIRQGVQLKSPLLSFREGKDAVLPVVFDAPPEEVGKLLLFLGRSLGSQLPRESVPPEAYPLPETASPEPIDGPMPEWQTVSLTRLQFPWVCCDCGATAEEWFKLEAGVRLRWLVGPLTHYDPTVEIFVPICRACQATVRRKWWSSVGTGMAIGLFVGLLGVSPFLPRMDNVGTIAILVGTVIVGPLIGFLIGSALAKLRHQPAKAACYCPSKGTVALRFRRPEYAGQVFQQQVLSRQKSQQLVVER